MMNVTQFVRKYGISIHSEWADSNPNMDEDAQMYHFKVRLRRGGKQMTLFFSQGYGISGEPKADSVLSCLASDASSVDGSRGFEDWCRDLGYDTDSRKAERIYKACEKQAGKLKSFLGPGLYEQLLYETEQI